MNDKNIKLPIQNLSLAPHPNVLSLAVWVLDDHENVVESVVVVPGTEALQVYPTIKSLGEGEGK